MKIRKSQLRKIIREAINKNSSEYHKGYKAGRSGTGPCPMMSHDLDYMDGYDDGRDDWQLSVREDVRKRGNQYCAYVDDKVTKKDKENNPKLYKGKQVGSVKKTKGGKIKMKARACYASKKKANNAMAAAMM